VTIRWTKNGEINVGKRTDRDKNTKGTIEGRKDGFFLPPFTLSYV
jgi:hypothetical protein